jgi:CelD/BcsL family acetyltransferase involved in cellulose biosynthesis
VRSELISSFVYEGTDAVAAASPDWLTVLKGAGLRSVFSHPAWASTWHSVYGTGHPALIVIFRDDRQLVGVAPLQLTRYPGVRTRRLEFLSGSAMTRSQWLLNPRHLGQALHSDLIVVPGHEPAVLAAFRSWLETNEHLWDELRLTCVPATSPLAEFFPVLARGWSPGVEMDHRICVDTSGGWLAYREGLSKRQKRHLRYEPHAVARAAGDEPTLVIWRGDDVPRVMEEFLELIERRWAARGRLAMPRQNRPLYRRLSRRSELSPVFYTLVARGRPIAMQFGFDDGKRYVPYGFAFDPSLERTSTANVLIHYAIRQCCEDGHTEVDLSALALVERWAGQPRPRAHLTAISPSVAGRLRASALRLVSHGLTAAYGARAGQRASRVVGRIRLKLSRG